MARCTGCRYSQHEQFKGYEGRWLCFCPFRDEIDESGEFTYPAIENPQILICKTPQEDFDDYKAHMKTLSEAKTPKWCYFAAVDRSKEEQPGFDPDRQREVLWPKRAKSLNGKVFEK